MQESSTNQTLQIDLEKLPSIPHALLKLFDVIHDPDVSFSEITEIIQSDPSLTTRVMSVANSGTYYPLSEYKSFHRLVVGLGLKVVKTIAINSIVQQFFSQFNVDDNGSLADFWHSSLSTACLAKNLAHIIGYENNDEAYIAGLLHNMGKLVCLQNNENNYLQQIKSIKERTRGMKFSGIEEELTKMEQSLFGSSVPEIGAWIIRQFDDKSQLSDAVLYQREASEKLIGAPYLVQIINLAHKLSEIEDNRTDVFEEVSTVLDLNQALLEDLLKDSEVEVKKAARSLSIELNDDNTIVTNNEEIQITLAEKVRSIALSNSLQQVSLYHSEQELIEAVMNNIRLLFGLTHCVYLNFDEEKNCLKAQYGHHVDMEQFSQFNISTDAGITFAVQSLNRGVPVFSDNEAKSVLDQQLQRLLKSEEILCIPFMESLFDKNSDTNEQYGVLIAGINNSQSQNLKREKGLLYEFSCSTSEVIARDRNIHKQINQAIEEDKLEQSLAIRKLVHEANNPIGVIQNYLQILSHKLMDSDAEKLQGQVQILMDEVERVGNILLRMREAPEPSTGHDNQVDINNLISKLLTIFKESLFLKSGIEVITNLDTSIPVIESNSNSIKQIITNLLKNAAEAMPDGGIIHINTRDQVNFNGQQYIELSIIDNGPGISDEVMKNLFNPVQTTKSKEHSGLGLSITKNLVNDLGGTIGGSNRYAEKLSMGAEKKTSSGAEFHVLLPRKQIE